MNLVFLSGTPANVEQGSGTYAGIAALRHALIAQGHAVELIAPARASASAWRRIAFNLRLRRRKFPAEAAIVGFDWDGLFTPRAQVASIKGVLAEEMQFERGLPRARLWMQSRLERRRVRQAARVLTTSRYAALSVEHRYGIPAGRIRVVPELLDVGTWQRELAQAPVQTAAAPVVLCVAHLYPRKDIATLLHALAQLPEARAHIAGDGPERARWQQLSDRLGLGDRVAFLGHIARAQLLREYRNATLFCLPSRQEGFGIVLLEAMASGLAVVAARAGAIPEVAAEPECTRLFPPGDAAALAVQLRALLADAELRARLAETALQRVLRFDAAHVAKQFLAAIGGS